MNVFKMRMKLLYIIVFFSHSTFYANNKDKEENFKVFYKDGNSELLSGKIKMDKSAKTYCLYAKNNKIIYPYQTYKLCRITGLDNRDTITGIAQADGWMFSIFTGAINGYSYEPVLSKDLVTHLQKGNGPIYKLKKEDVAKVIIDWISDNDSTVIYLDPMANRFAQRKGPSPAFHPTLLDTYIGLRNLFDIIETYNIETRKQRNYNYFLEK